MALLAFVYVLAAFCIALSVQTPYVPCSNGESVPKDLRIKGCDKLPCSLIRGSNLEVEWDFTVKSDCSKLRPVVKVTMFNNTIDYRYNRQDACKDLVNGQCPLEKGEDVTYGLKMLISKFYPSIALTIQFSLVDEKENTQVCFKMPATVV